MSSITRIDRATHKLLCARINAALAQLGKDLGVTFTAAGGTLGLDGETAADIKVRVKTADTGAAEAAARKEWDTYCTLYGLRPEVFGMTFDHKMARYKVVGINPGRSKNVVKTERLRDGKVYIWSAEAVRAVTKTTRPDGQGSTQWGTDQDIAEAEAAQY